MPVRIRDALNELKRQNANAQAGDTNVTYNVDGEDARPQLREPTRENTGSYFSTGERPILVDETDWSPPMGFGILAETVNVRFTDDLFVAFADPNKRPSNAIYLQAEESPMTIGGSAGLQTAFMWFKKADSAEDDPVVQVIAYE